MTRRITRLSAIALFGISLILISGTGARAKDPAAASAGPELKLVKTIPVGGVGSWDYPLIDPGSKRLYVARGKSIVVVNTETGETVGEVTDLDGAHGVAIIPQKNLGFATSGRESMIVVFDLTSFKTTKKIKSGQNPDAILYDPSSQKVFAFGGREVTVIDPAALDKPQPPAPIGVKLESAVADGAGRIYVSDGSKNEILALDSKQLRVTGHWPLDPMKSPSGLAMDVEHHRLYVACANKKLAVVDTDSGKVVGSVAVGTGAEGVAFIPQLGAVCANGTDGTVTVIRESTPGQYAAVQTLKTISAARTLTLDPKGNRLYLPGMLSGEKGTGNFGVAVLGR